MDVEVRRDLKDLGSGGICEALSQRCRVRTFRVPGNSIQSWFRANYWGAAQESLQRMTMMAVGWPGCKREAAAGLVRSLQSCQLSGLL